MDLEIFLKNFDLSSMHNQSYLFFLFFLFTVLWHKALCLLIPVVNYNRLYGDNIPMRYSY